MWPFGKSTAQRVKEALDAQPRLQSLGLQVQESGGNVSVSGMVPDLRYGPLVKVVVEGISGVKNVDVSGLVADPQQAQATSAAPSTDAAQESAGDQASVPTPEAPTPSADLDAELKQAEDSSAIAKAVYHAIRSNGELTDNPIDVLQSGSSVILRGAVDNDHEQRLAEQIARGVSGVSGVDIGGLKVIAQVKEMSAQRDESSGDATYTVKSGDTLSAIAQRYFNDPMRYKDIAHYNNISNPDHIEVGQVIHIPSA